MRALIVGKETADPTGCMYQDAFHRRSVDVEWISMDEFLGLVNIANPSVDLQTIDIGQLDMKALRRRVDVSAPAILVSNDHGHLAPLVFQVFEMLGLITTNSSQSVLVACDKGLTHQRLIDNGLPTPRSKVAKTADGLREALLDMQLPAVVKPLMGNRGTGVTKVDSIDADFAFGQPPYLVQQYIECGSYDTRMIFLEGEFVVAIERRAPAGDFRSNIALGGSAVPCDITAEDVALGRQIARALNLNFAGLDMGTVCEYLPGREYFEVGQTFCFEVNAMPALKMAMQVTGIDVSQQVVDSLLRRFSAS